MSAITVRKDLKILVTWRHMKEFTQEKCLMNAKHARKDSIKAIIWRNMKEFIQVKDLFIVTNVEKNFHNPVIWPDIVEEFIDHRKSEDQYLYNVKKFIRLNN